APRATPLCTLRQCVSLSFGNLSALRSGAAGSVRGVLALLCKDTLQFGRMREVHPAKGAAMQVAAGPARYYFLRHARAAREDVPNWPPEIKPMQIPDNQIYLAVYLFPEELGWRAVGMQEDATSRPDADGAFVLTRETTLGLIPGNLPSSLRLALLGVRVAQQE